MQNKPSANGILVHCAHSAIVAAEALVPHPRNPNTHPPEQIDLLAHVIRVQGWRNPIVVSTRSNYIVAGHGRLLAALKLGVQVPVDYQDFESEEAERAHLIADNRIAELAETNLKSLAGLLAEFEPQFDKLLTGFAPPAWDALLKPVAAPVANEAAKKKLAERFGVAPFSVLDARRGEWQDRKRAWLALGIRSEVGRGGNLLKFSDTVLAGGKADRGQTPNMGGRPDNPESKIPNYYEKLNSGMTREAIIAEFKAARGFAKAYGTTDWIKEKGLSGGAQNIPGTAGEEWTGTSIFDPVLTEILYRWFCPPGGRILDPFAGGSVRGIVAGWLGFGYTGIDLRPEQIEANRAQGDAIIAPNMAATAPEACVSDPDALTPVQERGGFFFKRDDLFHFTGEPAANGGKVRTMLRLAAGANGLVACGDRISTQIPRAAITGKLLGLPVQVHTASGEPTEGMQVAAALGAEIVQHEPGYLTVVRARAREAAEANGWREIPWAVECVECVEATAPQAANLPPEAKRIIVVVGSGMSLAGILTGMERNGNVTPVLGVMVGGSEAKVEARLDEFAPKNWRERVQLVTATEDFHSEASVTELAGVRLDPFYEAKVIPFVQPGDCIWCVGVRAEASASISKVVPRWEIGDSKDCRTIAPGEYDLVFSCPPYADLEVYSDDPRDLSAQAAESYDKFLVAYRNIIAESTAMLKPGRFACFIVGDVRDKAGNYRNFVSDTIAAFRDAGLHLYNEVILVTACGSLAIRVGRQFSSYRKVGKTHQNVLVFLKGEAGDVKGWPVPDFSLAGADFEQPAEAAAQPENS